jgi:hypothetical protein
MWLFSKALGKNDDFLDPQFGLIHLRLQTCLPFTVQVYVEGGRSVIPSGVPAGGAVLGKAGVLGPCLMPTAGISNAAKTKEQQ